MPDPKIPASSQPSDSDSPVAARWMRELTHERLALSWVVVCIAGSGTILFTVSGGWKSLLVPLVLMGCYFAYGISLQRKNTNTFADSLYFLGLLWTLVALMGALMRGQLTSLSVFTAFGYALSTTALGMFLRALVVHYHETIPDRLDDAEIDLDAQLVALSDGFRELTADLDRFRTAANTRLTKSLDRVVDSFASKSDAVIKKQDDAVAASLGVLAKASDLALGQFGKLETLTETLNLRVGALNGSLGTLATRVDHFASAGKAMPLEDFSIRLSAVTDELAKAGAVLQAWQRTMEALQRTAQSTSERGTADLTRDITDARNTILSTKSTAEHLERAVREVIDFIQSRLKAHL